MSFFVCVRIITLSLFGHYYCGCIKDLFWWIFAHEMHMTLLFHTLSSSLLICVVFFSSHAIYLSCKSSESTSYTTYTLPYYSSFGTKSLAIVFCKISYFNLHMFLLCGRMNTISLEIQKRSYIFFYQLVSVSILWMNATENEISKNMWVETKAKRVLFAGQCDAAVYYFSCVFVMCSVSLVG